MSLILSELPTGGKAKTDFGRLDDGAYLARIVSVIDYGLQPQTDWETKKPTDPKHILAVTYETPDEMITYKDKEGNEVTKPRWISKEYPLTLNEKSNLTKLIKALKPDLKSLDEFLNMPCMINVGSTSGDKAKVTATSKPMKGVEVKELHGDAFHFDFSHPNMELFNGLLAWQQNKIKDALDYNGFADNVVKMDSTGTSDF